jgi:hypothetical protein
MKHLGWRALKGTASIVARHLLHGQTNFLRMLWKFNSVYNPKLQLSDHQQPVRYAMSLPSSGRDSILSNVQFVHEPRGRKSRQIDEATEEFVNESLTGT